MRQQRSGRSLAATLVLAGGLHALASEGPRPGGKPDAADRRAMAVGAELEAAYPLEARPNGVTREFTIRAAPTTLPLFDSTPMDVWAYNGQVPGPTLRIKLGETLRVRLRNDLPQPTTIHWHGVRVPNAMDGVPGVTQPPVPPGGEFVYEFTPKDAGTYWFHPHLRASEQVERGLFGVLIVEDPKPPPYSRELVWVLDDWHVDAGFKIIPEFNAPGELTHDGRWGRLITVNGQRSPKVELMPGERVRLRLVNVANGRVFALSFGGLDPRVIAVDGLYTARPLDAAGFLLAPGNRVDLDLAVPADAAGRSWPVTDQFQRRRLLRAAEFFERKGVLSFVSRLKEVAARTPELPVLELTAAGKPIATPAFTTPARAHVPDWGGAAERPLRAEFALQIRSGGELGFEWTINGQAFDHHAHTSGGTDMAVLPYGQWSKLRFRNQSTRIHPMHLHGSFFKLLTRDGQRVDEPFFRDTVLVQPEETVEIGLVPVEKGRWMMHCHILEHAESGMMAVLRVE